MLVFHTHTCLLIACLYTHCVLAYSPLHIMLAYLHLHTLTLAYFALGCFRSSSVCVCKCKCRSVSVQRIFRKNPSQCFREKVSQEHHKCKEAESLESQMLYQSITVSTATNSSITSGKNMVICSSQEHHRWQDHEASFNVKRLPILISFGIGKSLAAK